MDFAPGDHVETILRGNLARAGDTIRVYGDLEHARVGGDGYRQPAVEAIKAVRAYVIAIGEDGKTQIEAWLAAMEDAETKGREAKEQEARAQQASRSSKPAARSAAPEKKNPLAEGPLSLRVPGAMPSWQCWPLLWPYKKEVPPPHSRAIACSSPMSIGWRPCRSTLGHALLFFS